MLSWIVGRVLLFKNISFFSWVNTRGGKELQWNQGLSDVQLFTFWYFHSTETVRGFLDYFSWKAVVIGRRRRFHGWRRRQVNEPANLISRPTHLVTPILLSLAGLLANIQAAVATKKNARSTEKFWFRRLVVVFFLLSFIGCHWAQLFFYGTLTCFTRL